MSTADSNGVSCGPDAMAKTLCPNCGHSPIPAGASECPKCGEPFDFLQTHKKAKNKFIDKLESEDNEITTFGGGLTGEVSAHPWPSAIVLLLGAAAWFVRAAGIFGTHEPQWTYGIVVAALIAFIGLITNLGPAKMIAQAVALAQLGAAAYLGQDDFAAPLTLAFIVQGVIAFISVFGEPGPIRRYLTLGSGIFAALFCVFVLGILKMKPPVVVPTLAADALGVTLRLPAGMRGLAPGQLSSALTVPPATLTSGNTVFGDTALGRYGVVTVATVEGAQLIGFCAAQWKLLGGKGEPEVAAHAAPASFGAPNVVYRLKTQGGANGLLACAKRKDGRLVALAVVQMSATDAQADLLFDAVGSGLQLK